MIDTSYTEDWTTSTLPAWAALDLRTIGHADLHDVGFIVDNNSSIGFLSGAGGISPTTGYPTTYTIDVHPSNGSLPAQGDAGWVTLQSVSSITYPRAYYHLGDIARWNWLRVRVTAIDSGTTLSITNLELVAANDGIMIVGDSTTQWGSNLYNFGAAGGSPASPTNWINGPQQQRVNVKYPAHWPAIVQAGQGGMDIEWVYTNRSVIFDNFPGPLVVIDMGINDARTGVAFTQADKDNWHFGSGGSVATPTGGLLGVVDYVVAQGKKVMIARTQWVNDPVFADTNTQALAGVVDQVVSTDRKGLFAGPDLWTLFHNLGTSFLQSDLVHPTFGDGGGYDKRLDEFAKALGNWYVNG